MSIATLNRIVKETDVFYNTKRERDGKKEPTRRGYDYWMRSEIKILNENWHLTAEKLAELLDRTVYSVQNRRNIEGRPTKKPVIV